MACLTAALGLIPLSGASAPAVSSARLRIAEETGKLAVHATSYTNQNRPSQRLSKASFLNAITVLQAIGGSTNAVVHMIAIINRHPDPEVRSINLDTVDQIGRTTPLLVDLKPSGEGYMTDFHAAGGMKALIYHLRPLLHLDAYTYRGSTLGDVFEFHDDNLPFFIPNAYSLSIIRPLSSPLYPSSSLVVLRGNLAPNGAIMKASASKDPRLLSHSGPAVVFDNTEDLARRIDSRNLNVTRDSVLVLKNIGPKGFPGMPEAGLIPIPRKLARQGVSDMLRISDGRMSGTAGGTVVLHVSPEAAEQNSVFGVVEDGDVVRVDVESRVLELVGVGTEEIEERTRKTREKRQAVETERLDQRKEAQRGYRRLYIENVNQAHEGADFGFLTATGR
ncbi:MAG: hypothetical protein LQ340_006358 [Diploschistes diacapsis]|nr:MAG: hypothetical protein LQ340_006358 [Diploschistes diacapsis]